MNKITVTLLGIHGLEAAYRAVKKPYKNEDADGKKLLHKVAKVMKHESVLEHIVFQFDVTGSSRLELQEHMRHRMASTTVESTRYALTEMKKDVYNCSLFSFKDKEMVIRKYTVIPIQLAHIEEKIIKQRFKQLKLWAKIFDKFGADFAKYELIESIRTSFVWTINARSMLNFLKLRTSKNAHFEIRHIANLMSDLLCENEEIKGLINE